ncbi:ethylene-responsive transcription factor 9-like [Solanum stenotomum]|uniref:ethylene-responsive transcription factor 9-like n=1 Tax=Solanum stenotomum TaxID=172797 RepID=UPI0020D176BC|nr:ethylene-responsive transcription factor 9-like [Solanum stenotomum]
MTEGGNCIVVVVTTTVTANEVPYRGARKRSHGKYKAEFTNQKLCVWLGNFDTQEEATRSYDKAARMYHDAKSKLNFPMSNEDNLENGIVAIVTIVVTPTEIRYRSVGKIPWRKYKTDITNQKVCVWLGTFDRKEEAAKTYPKAMRMYRGLKAKINFPTLNEDNLENEELNLELILVLSGRK